METPNSNTQVQPAPAPSAALTPEQLQARITELEKQSEGRLKDLQSERQKRQDLEARINSSPAPSPESNKDVKDELKAVLDPYIKPVEERAKRAEAFIAQTQMDKAADFLSQKTGKSRDAVLADEELGKRLSSIANRFGFRGDVYSVTTKAWEIYELENLRSQEAERRRAEEAAKSGSIPTGTHVPAKVGSREYSEEDFNALPLGEYDKLSSEGTFLQNKEGKIVYTPNTK